ncbi:MAG: hypothetical protein WAZ40_02730 [Minisyncoccia bacterium]
MIKRLISWKYRNTALLICSLVALFVISDTEIAHTLIKHIGRFGYLGAGITGVFFVSTFTVAPASLVLFHLAQEYNPLIVALCSGAGAVLGDLIIFHFLKDGVFTELEPLFEKIRGSSLNIMVRTRYFVWLNPVVGALIIASPLPDEIGIAMMGLTKIKIWQFALLTFVLNSLGIFLIVTLATVF